MSKDREGGGGCVGESRNIIAERVWHFLGEEVLIRRFVFKRNNFPEFGISRCNGVYREGERPFEHGKVDRQMCTFWSIPFCLFTLFILLLLLLQLLWWIFPKNASDQENRATNELPPPFSVQRGPFVFVSFCADPSFPNNSGSRSFDPLWGEWIDASSGTDHPNDAWLLRFTNTSPPPCSCPNVRRLKNYSEQHFFHPSVTWFDAPLNNILNIFPPGSGFSLGNVAEPTRLGCKLPSEGLILVSFTGNFVFVIICLSTLNKVWPCYISISVIFRVFFPVYN